MKNSFKNLKILQLVSGNKYCFFKNIFFYFLFIIRPVTYKFCFVINKTHFEMRLNKEADVTLIKEIFIDRQYDVSFFNKKGIKTIFDFGSNIGVSALYFLNSFPNAKIFAVEPSPDVFKLLKVNLKEQKNVELIEGVVGTKDGEERIFYEKGLELSTSMIKRKNLNNNKIVKSYALDKLIKNIQLDKTLLKFDIEGAEYDVFKNSILINKVSCIVVEFHEDLTGYSLLNFINLLPKHNYIYRQIANKRYIVYFYK